MSNEQTDIPPVNMIKNELSAFEERVPAWGLTVFTIDGYIIAHSSTAQKIPEGIEYAISSLSAGLITISEDFIRMVDQTKLFKEVLVDSVDETGENAFSIILRTIADNVMLACVFPKTSQLGLITFEIDNLSDRIREITREWDVKLHSETLT